MTIEQANEILKSAGITNTTDSDRGDYLAFVEHNGQVMLCDHNTCTPVEHLEQLTREAILAEARQWLDEVEDCVECHFCNATVSDVSRAVDLGWIPSFIAAGDEYETPDPVCPACQETHLEVDEDTGEFVQVTDAHN